MIATAPQTIRIDRRCGKGWEGEVGDCKRAKIKGAATLAKSAATWGAGKVVGGAVAGVAQQHGIPVPVAARIAESATQALFNTALNSKGKNAKQLATDFISESLGLFVAKDPNTIDDAIAGGDEHVKALADFALSTSASVAAQRMKRQSGALAQLLKRPEMRLDATGDVAEAVMDLAIVGALMAAKRQRKDRACQPPWEGTKGQCRRAKAKKVAVHGGEMVASWAVGKVAGGAIAQLAVAHGVPHEVAKVVSESSLQALTATAIHAATHPSSPKKLAEVFVTQAAAAAAGKIAHGEVGGLTAKANPTIHSLSSLVAGKTSGIGTVQVLENHGKTLQGLISRMRGRADATDASQLTKAEMQILMELGAMGVLMGAKTTARKPLPRRRIDNRPCRGSWEGTLGSCKRASAAANDDYDEDDERDRANRAANTYAKREFTKAFNKAFDEISSNAFVEGRDDFDADTNKKLEGMFDKAAKAGARLAGVSQENLGDISWDGLEDALDNAKSKIILRLEDEDYIGHNQPKSKDWAKNFADAKKDFLSREDPSGLLDLAIDYSDSKNELKKLRALFKKGKVKSGEYEFDSKEQLAEVIKEYEFATSAKVRKVVSQMTDQEVSDFWEELEPLSTTPKEVSLTSKLGELAHANMVDIDSPVLSDKEIEDLWQTLKSQPRRRTDSRPCGQGWEGTLGSCTRSASQSENSQGRPRLDLTKYERISKAMNSVMDGIDANQVLSDDEQKIKIKKQKQYEKGLDSGKISPEKYEELYEKAIADHPFRPNNEQLKFKRSLQNLPDGWGEDLLEAGYDSLSATKREADRAKKYLDTLDLYGINDPESQEYDPDYIFSQILKKDAELPKIKGIKHLKERLLSKKNPRKTLDALKEARNSRPGIYYSKNKAIQGFLSVMDHAGAFEDRIAAFEQDSPSGAMKAIAIAEIASNKTFRKVMSNIYDEEKGTYRIGSWMGDGIYQEFDWGKTRTDDATPIKRILKWHGFEIGVQYFPFEKRHRRTLPAAYGHFRRTRGADGMAVNVYVGTNLASPRIFAVDQIINGEFDEEKMIIGVDSAAEARAIYTSAMPEEFFGGMREISVAELERYRVPMLTRADAKPRRRTCNHECECDKCHEARKDALEALLRLDARKVRNSAGKVKGKKCGKTYISASYNCKSHRTKDGKLTAEGKAAAKELAGKERAKRGLPTRAKSKPAPKRAGRAKQLTLLPDLETAQPVRRSQKNAAKRMRQGPKLSVMEGGKEGFTSPSVSKEARRLLGAMNATDERLADMKSAVKKTKGKTKSEKSLQQLFEEADRVGSKYQGNDGPTDLAARRRAKKKANDLVDKTVGQAANKGMGVANLGTPKERHNLTKEYDSKIKAVRDIKDPVKRAEAARDLAMEVEALQSSQSSHRSQGIRSIKRKTSRLSREMYKRTPAPQPKRANAPMQLPKRAKHTLFRAPNGQYYTIDSKENPSKRGFAAVPKRRSDATPCDADSGWKGTTKVSGGSGCTRQKAVSDEQIEKISVFAKKRNLGVDELKAGLKTTKTYADFSDAELDDVVNKAIGQSNKKPTGKQTQKLEAGEVSHLKNIFKEDPDGYMFEYLSPEMTTTSDLKVNKKEMDANVKELKSLNNGSASEELASDYELTPIKSKNGKITKWVNEEGSEPTIDELSQSDWEDISNQVGLALTIRDKLGLKRPGAKADQILDELNEDLGFILFERSDSFAVTEMSAHVDFLADVYLGLLHEDATPCNAAYGYVGTTKASGGKGCKRKKGVAKKVKRITEKRNARSKQKVKKRGLSQAMVQERLIDRMEEERSKNGKTKQYRSLEKALANSRNAANIQNPEITKSVKKSIHRRAKKERKR